jgi:serine/threonine-protein kinase
MTSPPVDPAPDTDPPLTTIGDHYSVERELGRGGMAAVYLCTDTRTGARVAVKVLRAEISSPVVVQRFLREIEWSSKLDHPRIPKVFDSGTVNGMPFYAMSYIEGESLRSRIIRERQLPVNASLKIICEVISAAAYAHENGIIHRDIKPENIICGKDGIYVLDFGIARAITESGLDKLTSTGIGIGTPAYMSPEQAIGDKTIDARSDIYSIGCVLYEMIAGIPPFVGPTAQVIISRRFAASAPKLSETREGIPDWLESAVARSLAKSPADRWETAKEFSDALSSGPTGAAANERAEKRSRNRNTRRMALIAGAAAVVIAVAAMSVRAFAGRNSGAALPRGALDAHRIAVLYFQDLSPTHELGYLADELTESVIDQLDEVKSLDVISKNGVQQVRQGKLDADSAAHLLKAGTVVEGTVSPAGDKIRVGVKVMDGNSGNQIESATFDYDAKNQLALNERFIQDVADFLRPHIGQQVRLQRWQAGTQNQEAWLLMQRAEKSMKDAEALTASGDTAEAKRKLAAADSLLLVSEKQDTKWIDPIVMRAIVAFRRSRIAANATEMAQRIDEGMASAESAVALDSSNAEALEMRGTLRYWRWLNDLITDPKESARAIAQSEQDLKRAVRLDSARASAWSVLSTLYANKPDPAQAAFAARQAYKTDAYLAAAPDIVWRLYNTAYDNEQAFDAAHWCTEGQKRFPTNPRFVQCQLWLFTMPGTTPDVLRAWNLVGALRKVTPDSDWPFAGREAQMLVAAALARANLKDSARHVLEKARGNPAIDPSRDLIIDEAVVRTILGDKAEAIRLLKAYLVANPDHRAGMAETQSWWWRELKTDPAYREMVGAS